MPLAGDASRYLRSNAVVRASRIARRLTESVLPKRSPLVSVVVPVYNVERYLASCLESVLAQTWSRLEVIVVNDGSTDSSRSIVEEFAQNDRRLRIVDQPNAGLGAARNTGVCHARGQYLTFVDSDDEVPPTAYELMVTSLERSGSDVAIGKMVRLRGDTEAPMEWAENLHSETREGVRVGDFPRILRDFYSPNKMYRTGFWRSHDFSFREGVLFEDQPLITDIYCRAGTVDVLRETTYRWRVRDDRSSLSQSLYNVPRIQARQHAILLTRDVVESRAPHLRSAWHWSLVDHHLPNYLSESALAGPEVLQASVDMVRALLAPAQVLAVPWCSAQNRVICYLASRHGPAAVSEFVAANGRDVRRFPVEVVAGRPTAVLPLFGSSTFPVPDECFALSEEQMVLRRWVTSVRWAGPHEVEVRGRAYLEMLSLDRFPTSIKILCVDRGTREVVRAVPTSPLSPPEFFGPPPNHRHVSYAGADFRARVDIRPLVETLAPNSERRSWDLVVQVSTAGVTKSGDLSAVSMPAMSGTELLHDVDAQTLATARIGSQGRPCSITAWRPGHIVGDVSGDERALDLEVCSPGARNARRWSLLDLSTGSRRPLAVVRDSDPTRVHLRVESPPAHWRVEALERFRQTPVAISQQLTTRLATTRIEVVRSPESLAAFRTPRQSAVVDRISTNNCGLSFHGRLPGFATRELRLSLVSKRLSSTTVTCKLDESGEFEALVPFEFEEWGVRHSGVLPVGGYRLSLTDSAGTPVAWQLTENTHPPAVISTSRLLAHAFRQRNQFTLRVLRPGGLWRVSAPELRELEAGWHSPDRKLRAAVFFQCLRGEVASDSQAQIHAVLRRRHPDLSLIWGVSDHTVSVPDGAEVVVRETPEWFDAIGTSRWICVNHELPRGFVKATGQIVIQTYHGHPFKLMGKARWRAQGLGDEAIERALDAARSWDYLLAPSPAAAAMYAEQFPTGVRMLQVGHPRNDGLVASDADQVRERTRKLLGIEEDEVAVLYAPTWRDYATTNAWRSRMVDFLDPQELADQLQPGHKLLVRGHPAHQRHPFRSGSSATALEVTDYPEINELILASDIGVFDYSSIRFDYSVTRKPMIFFVPDEQIYLSAVGSLIDYTETTPGPRVHDVSSLRAAILEVTRWRFDFAEQYEQFLSRFNPLDDGQAAERLVQAVFGEGAIEDMDA